MIDYPYAGLRPFKREETHIFFGREEHTDELLNRLSSQHFLAVTGVSGCGKSSLVKTGLIPSLQAGFLSQSGTYWRIAEMRPGTHPFTNLALELVKKDVLGEDYQKALFENEILKQGSFSLHELLAIKPLPNHAKLLIVCDQFEEIFRYRHQISNSEAAAFVALLLASSKPYLLPTGAWFNDIFVIITMRSDFFGECALFTGLAEAINAGLYLTPRLNREQLRSAIQEPALVCGGKVEPELVVKLLEDAGNNQDQLPLLQHVLMRLWYLADDKSVPLTVADYEAIGGLAKALSDHADDVYDKLEDEEQKEIAEILFSNLTEKDPGKRDTRRPIKLQKILDILGLTTNSNEEIGALKAVINSFRKEGRCFLTLNPDPKSDDIIRPDTLDTVIDISHESLIRQWERLKKWTKKEAESAEIYRNLERSALIYYKVDDDDKKELYHGYELKEAKLWKREINPTPQWASRYGEHYDLAMDFLKESDNKYWDDIKKRQEDEKKLAESGYQVEEIKKEVTKKNRQVEEIQKEIIEKNIQIEEIQTEVIKKDARMEEMQKVLEEIQKEVIEKNSQIEALKTINEKKQDRQNFQKPLIIKIAVIAAILIILFFAWIIISNPNFLSLIIDGRHYFDSIGNFYR